MRLVGCRIPAALGTAFLNLFQNFSALFWHCFGTGLTLFWQCFGTVLHCFALLCTAFKCVALFFRRPAQVLETSSVHIGRYD
jgi:hypothetical protein